jgi:hypothetical protein
LIRFDSQGFETYQFFYYSPTKPEIQSPFHGNEDFPERIEHKFDHESMNKVEGQIVNKTFISKNRTTYTKPVITGIKFTSVKNYVSPSYNESSGVHFEESIPGYRLGYVMGRATDNEYIEQIQFVWFRNL